MFSIFYPLTQRLRHYQTNLTRSSAIQQGLLNITIFLVSLFLLSIITYFFVQNALATRLNNSLQQRLEVLVEQIDDDWDDDDYDELPLQKNDQLVEQSMFYRIFPLRDLQKPQHRAFRKPGYRTQPLRNKSAFDDDLHTYQILVAHRNGLVFVVGENNENDQEILDIVLSAFLLNGLVALILTALLVIYLGNRAHQQIRRIEHVLQQAAQGDLRQRIGQSTKHNDLAHVSTQIDKMLARLETSMTAMTDISANIAHELKTPISRLRHDLITALDQHEQGKPAAAALKGAYEESEAITETFDALLRIAQIEGGARRAHFTALDLRAITGTVLDIYTEVAEDAGMSLALHSARSGQAEDQKPLLIQGDKELLIQMLANLVENAIRYCPAGTAIVIECTAEGADIVLSVTDNGPGIPAAERERVFQRLYRLDKSRSDKRGTGLGLSLVKAIVELHEARIKLLNNKPGLRVVMQFPAHA